MTIARPTIVGIIRSFLIKYHEEGRIHELKFDEVNAAVRTQFPNSRFNPFHFAHYKHKFLLKLNYTKMHRKQ